MGGMKGKRREDRPKAAPQLPPEGAMAAVARAQFAALGRLKPLTARVTPDTWRFFKQGSAELEVTQEQMLRTAIRLFSSKFREVPEREYRAVYERIRKETFSEQPNYEQEKWEFRPEVGDLRGGLGRVLETQRIDESTQQGYTRVVVEQLPDIGDATLEQTKSVIGGAIKKLSFAVVAKMIVEAASPDDRVLLADMVARARKEATSAQTPATPPKMSEADLAEFTEFASKPENIWEGDQKRMKPAAFIAEKFADFLKTGGVWLEHFRAVPVQRKLAEAYYKEVKRHPERALNIYIQPHSLPVGAERAASAKLVAERTDEERAAVQAKNTLSKQASRSKSKILLSSCP